MTRIEYLARADRAELCEMLEGEDDFPQHLLYLYQRPNGPDESLIAWRGDQVDGLLTGTFRHDFSNNRDFSALNLPQSPHALLTRVHVRQAARGNDIGRALVTQFAVEAIGYGGRFIGGYLDGTSDATGRRAFFECLGFTTHGSDTFGAAPEDVLASGAN